MRRLWGLICCVWLAGCTGPRVDLPELPAWQGPEGREHADLGRILDLHSGQVLTPSALVARLADADMVLVGERHDNPDHHALQRWLLTALAQHRPQGSVLLEMLDPAQQAKVDAVRRRFAEGRPPASPAEALAWQAGWDWSLYGDLVTQLLQQPHPLLAANLDREEIRAIYRARPVLDGPQASAAPVREALLEQIRRSHCDQLPTSQLPAMLSVQQQRDRRMAERLLAAPAPSLLIAGAFHVRRDLGVPLHLADLGREQGVKVLMLAEAGEHPEPGQADFVWFTPGQVPQDYCAQFERRGS